MNWKKNLRESSIIQHMEKIIKRCMGQRKNRHNTHQRNIPDGGKNRDKERIVIQRANEKEFSGI